MLRPSIAHVAVAALFALVAFPRAAIPLIDGDVWWHIRAGTEILETGRIAPVDTWSIAGEGLTWTSQDWLSNVVLSVLTGGPAAVDGGWGATLASVAFALLVVVAAALLWAALAARGVTGWLGRVAWLSFGLVVAGPVLGVRVQVIDLVLTTATVFLIWSYLARPRRAWLVGLPFVAFAWANLHAGWVLMFLVGGAVVVGEAADRRWRSVPEAHLDARQLGELTVALLVALAAIAANPNGPALYLYPIETALISAHRDFLAEWSPPSLASVVGQAFWAFVLAGVGSAVVLGWRRLRTADLLVLIGLTVMAASAARFLLVVPVAAAIVAIAWARVPSPAVVRRMANRPRTTGPAILNGLLVLGVVIGGMAVAAARVAPAAQEEAIGEHMPREAVDWMLANAPGQRVFNTYSWGGYLGLRRPGLPVYIDGRSDIYGDRPIRQYAEAVLLQSDPGSLLDRHRIDHVLFGVQTPLAGWLDESGAWERVYQDDLAAVWVRAGP